MDELPPCPECNSEYTYENGHLLACPDCAHEWSKDAVADAEEAPADELVRDAHGNELQSGDTVKLTKDLKVKGTSTTLKIGTKVKNIRLCDGDHDIDCKVDGIGAMKLKSEFVKKV
jgi:protein PhnA